MLLSAIVATDENGLIGRDNQLPWHLPADLKHFKQLTWGKVILMGRKTYESIGKALPGRINVIVTRDSSFQAKDCEVFHSIDQALSAYQTAEEMMVIGGAELFRQLLPNLQRLYLTTIHHQFSGNIFFPSLNKNDWMETEKVHHEPDEKNHYAYTFSVLVRRHY